MEIKNSPSFCGKIIFSENIKGLRYLASRKVKDVMRAAPKGTELHIQGVGGRPPQVGRLGFATPASDGAFISGDGDVKSCLHKHRVLTVIREGLELMKQGITKPCLPGEYTTKRIYRDMGLDYTEDEICPLTRNKGAKRH